MVEQAAPNLALSPPRPDPKYRPVQGSTSELAETFHNRPETFHNRRSIAPTPRPLFPPTAEIGTRIEADTPAQTLRCRRTEHA
jgi:hypothetical protein